MKRGTFFKKILLIMILVCVLMAILSGAIYSVTGVRMIARSIADEMVPRAYGIARLATKYLSGQVPFDSFADFALREQRNSNIFIYDSQGNLVMYTENEAAKSGVEYLAGFAADVCKTGNEVRSVDWQSVAGIVVGVPIFDNMQRVNGAVLISRPRSQVDGSMRSLIFSLILSSLGALFLLVVPAYLISKRISKPIKQMTDVATAMSAGDFSRRAEEDGTYELGTLGSALNHLSGALNNTIQELMIAKDRLHKILHGLGEGVVAMDCEGHVTYFNPAAADLLGCMEDVSAIEAELAEASDIRQRVLSEQSLESRLLKRERNTLQVTVSPIQESAADDGMDAVILLQDVSEYERLEQTRRDYVANVSHELRTPIASIRGLAEALNDGLIKDEEDRSRYYGYILRESLRLSRLINDLLELSRLQSGTVAIEETAFDLDALLGEVTERMRLAASYSGISLVYQSTVLPQAYSNRDRIEQVLISLIDNAVKYADDDGIITVSAEPKGEKIVVSIRNTGHIADCDLPHIFERFYKADASHSAGGTGLGLAITKEILTRLGESIEASNEGAEAVMRFTVTVSSEKFTK